MSRNDIADSTAKSPAGADVIHSLEAGKSGCRMAHVMYKKYEAKDIDHNSPQKRIAQSLGEEILKVANEHYQHHFVEFGCNTERWNCTQIV